MPHNEPPSTPHDRSAGFTMAELLVVVAIIAVLVAVAIPVFAGQLERSRETVDLANIRSAYAEVMVGVNTGGAYKRTDEKKLEQRQDGWQTSGLPDALSSIADIDGKPEADGTFWVEYDPATSASMPFRATVHFSGAVPGDKATVDAADFPVGSQQHKYLSSLASAEREALKQYRAAGETGHVGYYVTFGADGSWHLERTVDSQSFKDVKLPAKYAPDRYIVVVNGDKVGSNLVYKRDEGELYKGKYHILHNKWNDYVEGVDFTY